MDGKVYIGKKADGTLVHHTDVEAMKELDGVDEILMEVPLAEFEAKGGLVREINGKIHIGKTEAENTAEENQQKIIRLKRQLAETDYVSAKIAEGSATKAEYADTIAQRKAWRSEINALSA
jgi:hypothetical protein